MANEGNLTPVRSKNEAREKGRNGGIKSGEVRRAKKTMRETAKMMLNMRADAKVMEFVKKVAPVDENDITYQTAVVARMVQRAIADGDTASVRVLAELTGDISRGFGFGEEDDEGLVEIQYPTICLPDNGRDRRNANEIGPQAGPQTMFMTSSADIIIYGGAAGGGKTFALLLEALRHKDVAGFGGVIFRQQYNQITAEGGLWDSSNKLFNQVPDAEPRKSPKLHWRFKGGAKLNFAHIEREEDLRSWQGTQIAYIGFDELTHFTKHMFLFMLSRNRSTCGVKPYVRATCNPDADSWVADLISWWIDQDTGYPIAERSGQIRWMVTINDAITFFPTREEAVKHALDSGIKPEEAEIMPKSFTFIASSIEDNKKLLEVDPGYMANLRALTEVDMERLLKGNWKIKAAAGKYFQRAHVAGRMLSDIPTDVIYWCRAWDIAATDEDEGGDPDFTSSTLMGRRKDGSFVVANVTNDRVKAGDVENLLKVTAIADRARFGAMYHIRIPQDPGAAGKIVAKSWVKMLAGFNVKAEPVSGSKEDRATPFAAQWQNGNVYVVEGPWNDMYFSQLESFPESKHDDMVDSSSDAFNECAEFDFDFSNLL